GIVAAGPRAARFATRVSRYDRCLGDFAEVIELERLDSRGIERLALVLDRNATRALLELNDLGHALGQKLLVAIDAAVRLHGTAQALGDFRNLFPRCRAVDARKACQRGIAGILRQRLVRAPRKGLLDDLLARRASEDEQIEERVCA